MSNDWEMPQQAEQWKAYRKQAEVYFEKHVDEIHAFTSKYNFQIDKFTRGSSTWDLGFKNPKGGYATIFIGLSDEENVRVSGCWSLDVLATFSMYMKTKNFIDDKFSEVSLTEWLEKAFREILSWKTEELEVVNHEGYYKRFWRKYKTEEEFLKAKMFWPQNYPKGYEPWASDTKDKK